MEIGYVCRLAAWSFDWLERLVISRFRSNSA
jgi:hypothetical protein